MMSDVQISGFTGAPQSINVASPLPRLLQKRSSLERQLRQVNREIEWLERKQALAEFVAADRINSGRVDIPTLAEVVEWDVHFKAQYKAKHQERNAAALASTNSTDDPLGSLGFERLESVHEVLATEDKIQALDTSIANYFDGLAQIRGVGYHAAEPLVGQREPRLSLLTVPEEYAETKLAWWVGAYQRIGLL